MNKILITGSAGFLGSNLIRYIIFNNKNTQIIGIDRLDSMAAMHNVYMNKSSEFYLANICDEDILNKIFEITKPDCVIHLANSVKDNCYTNMIGYLNVLNSVIKYKIKKVIYISTANMYSQILQKVNEESDIFPYNEDVTVKICCEMLLKEYSNNYNFDYNIIRSVEVFGPRQHNGIITNMFLDLKLKENILLYNKGGIIKDLLYIDDFSNAVMSVISNGAKKQTYNISSNNDFTELEIALMMIEFLNCGKVSFYDETISSNNIEIDSSKIKEHIGWKIQKKFRNRLKDTCSWYKNNNWFFTK